MTPRKKLGVSALAVGAVVICGLPAASQGGNAELKALDGKLRQSTQQLGNSVEQSIDRTEEALRKTERALRKKTTQATAGAARAANKAKTRATATDPVRQPPLHGTNPHGQGGVAVVDLNPSSERPLGGNPDGSDAGPEDIVVGRARGEKTAAGAFHGHITIAALFGSEILGVDTPQGESKTGPLQPIQEDVLNPLCNGTSQQICLSLLTANSATTSSGSTNDFAVARAKLGGLSVGAAESAGKIDETTDCQTSTGSAKTANVTSTGGAIAEVANSASTSKSCANQAPQTLNSSTVIALGGQGIPLPAAGCADGTPDTVAGLPPLLPIVCNADEIVGASAVREALDVFVLTAGNNSLAKETTAASESVSVAPKGPEKGKQCEDKVDNDGDKKIDDKDPGCHEGDDIKKPYNPKDDDERNAKPTGPSGPPSEGPDKDGEDGKPIGPSGKGGEECQDGIDNDGDGKTDMADPECTSPTDDSEANGGVRTTGAGALPFTGTDVIGLGLAGLLVLGGGLLMRRREGARADL